MVIIESFIQTCGSCPSQWTAWDTDGREVYIRFRGGWFYAQRAPADRPNNPFADDHDLLLATSHGHPFDGTMSTEEMQDLTGQVMCWASAKETPDAD